MSCIFLSLEDTVNIGYNKSMAIVRKLYMSFRFRNNCLQMFYIMAHFTDIKSRIHLLALSYMALQPLQCYRARSLLIPLCDQLLYQV
jgi:hypothetical protein